VVVFGDGESPELEIIEVHKRERQEEADPEFVEEVKKKKKL
jgi:hypothetical protein